jgi:hypothetical protein
MEPSTVGPFARFEQHVEFYKSLGLTEADARQHAKYMYLDDYLAARAVQRKLDEYEAADDEAERRAAANRPATPPAAPTPLSTARADRGAPTPKKTGRELSVEQADYFLAMEERFKDHPNAAKLLSQAGK